MDFKSGINTGFSYVGSAVNTAVDYADTAVQYTGVSPESAQMLDMARDSAAQYNALREAGGLRNKTAFDRNAFDFKSTTYPSDLLEPNSPYGDNYMVFFINIHEDSAYALSNTMTAEDRIAAGLTPPQRGYLDGLSPEGVAALNKATATVGGAAFSAELVESAKKFATKDNLAQISSVTEALVGTVGGLTLKNVAEGVGLNKKAAYKTSRQAIALYVPPLTSTYQTNWSTHTTGSAAEMARISSELPGNFSEMDLQGGVRSIAEGMQYTALSRSLQALGPEVGNTILKTAGAQINPKKEQLFEGVGFRQHQFTYVFNPQHPHEAAAVTEIIKLFKLHMHPEFRGGTREWMYIYPSEFDICIYNGSTENQFVPKYTSCALTAMQVDYVDQYGMAFRTFEPVTLDNMVLAGMPTHIRMTLYFLELAQLSREYVEMGY